MSKAPTITPPAIPESQPFERFEWLAKRLMTVSKKELDKEIAKQERTKKRKKKRASP
jgi:hypothetical protein